MSARDYSSPFITASGRPVAVADAEGRMVVAVVQTQRRKPSQLHLCPRHALDHAGRGTTLIVQTPSASARMRCLTCGPNNARSGS